jgi:hypothetical protein
MADCIAGSANNATVLATNYSESCEVTCSGCVKLKIELEKTLTELKSMQKFVELLQEEVKLNTYHQTRGTDVNYLQRHEDSTQFGSNGRWTVVRPYHQQMNRNPQQLKIPLLVNHFAMPLEKFSDAIGAEGKSTITTKAAKEKSGSHRVLPPGDSQVRGCADLLKLNVNNKFAVSGFVKPGARASDILDTNIDKDMSVDDDVEVCDGSKDISNNDAKEGLRNIINFVRRTSHTNIIVMEALHRHD